MTPEEILKEFKDWAAGRTGLTLDELVDMFALERGLAPEQIKELKEELKKKVEEEERKKKEEEERKKKEEEERKKKEEEERKKKEEEERKRREEERKKGAPPKPPRPRGELFKLFLDFWKKNPSLQSGQAIAFYAFKDRLSSVEILFLKEDVAAYLYEQRKKEEEEREKRRKEEERKKEEEERKRREEEERKRREEEKKPPVQPKKKPDLIIDRTPYPKWWKDSLNAKIDFTAPGSQILATVTGKLRLYVSVIVITVTAETVITITFGNAGSSGPIYLGGTNQPMGMVVAMGNSPAPCGARPLSISATDPNTEAPLVGGWATCFAVEEKQTR